jgi:ParB/RepB/Spo0J family partition protein
VIKVGSRFRRDLGDIDALAKSISTVGLLHPIVINENNELIAGVRRLEACKKLGWTDIPVHVVNLEDIRKGQVDENVVRKDFTPSEIAAIYEALAPEEKAEAEKRKGTRTDLGKEPVRKFRMGRVTKHIGQYVGRSDRTLEKIVAIAEAAKEQPEKFGRLMEKVDKKQTSIHYAYKMVKRAEVQENPSPIPQGLFNVIYADPPWQYDLSLRGSPEEHYPVMATETICDLVVPAAKDSVLFLWATNPKLEEALQVMKAWGFTYKTNLVWVKDKFGNGYYFRGQHELLLLGIKGKPPVPLEADRPPSVLNAPRRKHSQKPEEVYELIEKMYPNGKYLELFARAKRLGWEAWGNEFQRKGESANK